MCIPYSQSEPQIELHVKSPITCNLRVKIGFQVCITGTESVESRKGLLPTWGKSALLSHAQTRSPFVLFIVLFIILFN